MATKATGINLTLRTLAEPGYGAPQVEISQNLGIGSGAIVLQVVPLNDYARGGELSPAEIECLTLAAAARELDNLVHAIAQLRSWRERELEKRILRLWGLETGIEFELYSEEDGDRRLHGRYAFEALETGQRERLVDYTENTYHACLNAPESERAHMLIGPLHFLRIYARELNKHGVPLKQRCALDITRGLPRGWPIEVSKEIKRIHILPKDGRAT